MGWLIDGSRVDLACLSVSISFALIACFRTGLIACSLVVTSDTPKKCMS